MSTTLRVVGYILLALAAAAIVIGYGWTFYAKGFGALLDLVSPFNVLNWLLVVAIFAPGYGLVRWENRWGSALVSSSKRKKPECR